MVWGYVHMAQRFQCTTSFDSPVAVLDQTHQFQSHFSGMNVENPYLGHDHMKTSEN
jgi:hypothetical protein